MSTENLPRNKGRKLISAPDDAALDDFVELLSPQLGDAADVADDEAPANEVLWLLEENARLRALAVQLSALVGDLSDREWSAALASADLATFKRVRSPRRL